jgi:2-amino-4-hydroxy-6-hydroxymethyldihydropteridine diphosphokinase
MMFMNEPITAYVALGSNVEHPPEQVRRALAELNHIGGSRVMRHSALYRSAPVGPADQPDYVNAVACLLTTLGPLALLRELQAIERSHGRVRGAERWGPRTLDLDLLLYDEISLNTPQLTVPHPRMHERGFVLVPLHEIAPELHVPGHGTVSELLARVPSDDVQRLTENPKPGS